jgi:hypothetical protein
MWYALLLRGLYYEVVQTREYLPTKSDLGSNQGLPNGKPVTNSLSYGMALFRVATFDTI